ncbi:MAG: aminodeoxychorismate synthase component I [Gammaproteobacteria bacterium]|nr:aminodeoxychorismate synthase component I [Gammaproteobacteria bacterium]MBT8134253.1 aminodeoxychorismate synthase component I [Gammaproteobacteria bacterium]NNJ49090.1 aminodeoxychorismate synthase component I [Gammaproteobacteria bacterium]
MRFHQLDARRYPYLLKSSAARENNTQYDILIACPQYQLTMNADKSLHCTDKDVELRPGFLDTLEVLFQKEKETKEDANEDHALPFSGGWFVFLSYEMAQEIEPCLSMPRLPDSQPLAVATRCPAAIVIDKQSKQCFAIAEDEYSDLLDEIEKDFLTITNSPQAITSDEAIELQSLQESDPEPYLEQVEKIKRYIVDGDIFQANLSRLWRAVLKQDVADAALFDALSRMNPSSFAALACFENMTIISSSPERLVSLRDGIVETRPIAGTRPRDIDERSDEALAKELLSHPKEQAEHIMLIDLERNDLGRVCQPGTIEVNELMVLESWQHVHHIVSNVRGRLADARSPVDVLRAVFPGGTITGCPKVRCIEILAELEQQARGAYTGSLGYINRDGSMDFNILIRTMVRDSYSNEISFRAGGGIVSDSVALNELDETRAKAKGLLKIFTLGDETDDQ